MTVYLHGSIDVDDASDVKVRDRPSKAGALISFGRGDFNVFLTPEATLALHGQLTEFLEAKPSAEMLTFPGARARRSIKPDPESAA